MLVVERKTDAKDISGGGQADQLNDFGVSLSLLGCKRILEKYNLRNSGQASWGLRSFHASGDHGNKDSQNDGDEVDVT